MSRSTIPPVYKLMFMLYRTPMRRAPSGTGPDANGPYRSRGWSKIMSPNSAPTVFSVVMSRELREP